MRRFVLAGILLCMSTLGQADPVKADSPGKYTVQKGDTLWDISTTFLDSPWQWPQIWHANPQIKNPHLIYPGDIISLVYIDGQPRLMVSQRGDTGRTIRLSPQVRVVSGESAIPAIPLSAIESHLHSGHVFSSEQQLAFAPYVFAARDGRLVSAQGDKVYARGSFAKDNYRFNVVRGAEQIVDPQTGELLGLMARDVAVVNVSRVQGDTASLIVQESKMELKHGDRLVRERASGLVSTFFPKAPEVPVDGIVTANLNNSKKISRFDTVIINRGKRESLQQGDVLGVYRHSEITADAQTGDVVALPMERVGLVMVYRSFAKMSYGIVLSAREDIEVGYILRNPQSM